MKKSLGPSTILYPTPTLLVGSYDRESRPNIMTAAWGGICCSNPPCVCVSLRKATYTHGNIVEAKAFTISVPSEDQVKETDFAGIVSGKNVDKFAATGLTAVKSALVNAPYVKECPLVLECEVMQIHELGLHTQFIGKILDVKVDEEMTEGDKPEINKIRPMIYDPASRRYFGLGAFLGSAFSVGKEIK
jgi:flavin reductase (DIM6/NTAB) family NADH-FMN oxidoreductase RutF